LCLVCDAVLSILFLLLLLFSFMIPRLPTSTLFPYTTLFRSSKITRFKQDFLMDLQSVFDHLVDITEPICHDIDNPLASMLLFDTSGIEAYVTENNPKYANRKIGRAHV